MSRIRTLIIKFSNEISHKEITLFRGAVINAMENADILFHNHTDNGLRYKYPLIQYKRIHGQAAIVCIGEGTDVIGEFFNSQNYDISLGRKEITLGLDTIKNENTVLEVGDAYKTYIIRKWLPFNQDNYKKYDKTESIVEQYSMLERLLTANILSFAKGVDIHIEDNIVVKITKISESKTYIYKGVKMRGFDLEFKSNISLPDFIGLGKGVSHGYGIINDCK